MANPQLEDGYTRIANDVLEALGKTRIPGQSRQLLDVIIRKTWGWGKKTDFISMSQLCEGTKLKKQTIIKARDKLVEMNLITVTQKGYRKSLNYGFNKDYATWKSLPKKVTVTNNGYNRNPKRLQTVTQKGTHKRNNKETITKENVVGSEQSSSLDEFVIILKDNSLYDIQESDVIRWEKVYTDIDVRYWLTRIVNWNLDNKKYRKTRGGILKHITGWLGKEQDKAREKSKNRKETADERVKRVLG